MPKLKLVAPETFEASVEIPLHGGGSQPVKFVFRHKTKTDLQAWRESLSSKKDAEAILDIVADWELEDELNEANVTRLVEQFAGSTMAIIETYVLELLQVKRKN